MKGAKDKCAVCEHERSYHEGPLHLGPCGHTYTAHAHDVPTGCVCARFVERGHLTPIDGVDLTGKTVVLKPEHFKGDQEARTFRCEGGFGCHPRAVGSAVFGVFVSDGERARVERYQIAGLAASQCGCEEPPPGKPKAHAKECDWSARYRYTVEVYRTTVERTTVEVDARSDDEATAVAREIAKHKPWKKDDDATRVGSKIVKTERVP